MQVPRDSAPKPRKGKPGRAHPASKGAGPTPYGPGLLPGGVERQVREALAEHLRRCPYLPPSLAQTLSVDALSLRLSSGGAAAGPVKPSGVDGAVNGTLPQDPGLALDELQTAIYGLCGDLCEHLAERHDLPPALAGSIALHGRERALTLALSAADPEAEIELLVASLAAEDALTPTLLLRSLSLGLLTFFALAMANLAETEPQEAGRLIFDSESEGFQSLYERSDLPPGLFRAFRAAMEVVRGLGPEPAHDWRREYTNRIIVRLVNEYEHVCPEDLEHVLCTLSHGLKTKPAAGPLRDAMP